MIPHERSLVEKLKDKPFALIGVNTDANDEAFKKNLAKHKVTWRSFMDGTPSGAICTKWAVNSFPTIMLLDKKGVIRYTNLYEDKEIEEAIEKLLAEDGTEKAPEAEKKGN